MTETDIEDEFLRLKEVFGCRISVCQSIIDDNKYIIGISINPIDIDIRNIRQIFEELKMLKERIPARYGADRVDIEGINLKVILVDGPKRLDCKSK